MKYFNFSDSWKFGTTKDGVSVLTPIEPKYRMYNPRLDLITEPEVRLQTNFELQKVEHPTFYHTDIELEEGKKSNARFANDKSTIVTSSTYVKLIRPFKPFYDDDNLAIVTLTFDRIVRSCKGCNILNAVCDYENKVNYAVLMEPNTEVKFGFLYVGEGYRCDYDSEWSYYYIMLRAWNIGYDGNSVRYSTHTNNFGRELCHFDLEPLR